jgi:hypothetical protein
VSEEQIKRDAISLLDGWTVAAEMEEWQDAVCFVALVTNDETKRIHINGVFVDATDAMGWADKHQEDLNRNLPAGEAPVVVTVHPVLPPE